MSKHGEVRRYSLIIEKIKCGHYPTFREIRDFLFSQGFQVGDRTIQRDIEQIRVEFGIEIKCRSWPAGPESSDHFPGSGYWAQGAAAIFPYRPNPALVEPSG